MLNLICFTKPSFLKFVSLKLLKMQSLSKQPTFICWASRIPVQDQNLTLPGKAASFSNWVPHNFSSDRLFPLKWVPRTEFSVLIGRRGFCTQNLASDDPKPAFRGPKVMSQARNALMEYLHFTAGLDFSDAEHMSKHSPTYLDRILKKVEQEGDDIDKAITRFLRYHPPNEFEVLFESMGMKPSEFDMLLPRDMIFLKDNEKLLDNYHVLCNYGIDRRKIGKIYMEAMDVFKYEWGVLGMKLKAYEELGLSKPSVVKVVASSPMLLVGDVDGEFVKVLEELEDVGIQRNWIGGALTEKNLCTWGRMLAVLQYCFGMGFTKHEVGTLIRSHPDFMLDGSGVAFLLLIGFLIKVSATRKEISSLIMRFPQVQAGKFMKNLRQGLLFLMELEMDSEDMRMLLFSHMEFLGQHTLKKACSVVSLLGTSKKKLCTILKEDPDQLKMYVKGAKLCPLPNTRSVDEEVSRFHKKKFLLRVGFVENSEQMQKALDTYRGKGDELQERFNCLVRCGLDPKDVCSMIKRSPFILNQKVDVLERKITFLITESGFPLSLLVAFPSCLACTIERVKIRILMYNWIKEKGKVSPSLALSSIIACSEEKFRKRIINKHPQGPKMWEKFKAEL